MANITIRPYFIDRNGHISDGGVDYDLGDFGGFLPNIGDEILDPGVRQGLARNECRNREIWTVERRVSNPRDLRDYVALICRSRIVEGADEEIIPI